MVMGLLFAIPLLLYLPALRFEFVNYDDNVYVTENPRVSDGLTWSNLLASFQTFQTGNWHPLTILSHMVDVSLYDMRPAGHHGTSVLLHAVNAALLFLLLFRVTARPWPSAFVAALFAVHPLNVQSVAWIAERKNPLSTLWWLLTLLAWVKYRERMGWKWYAGAVACAAMAMASKPMAVTLPLTLVLLDRWPLGKEPRAWGRWELVPFFALSVACGLLTLAAQASGRALQGLESYPMSVRLANAPLGYVWYLKKMLWPVDLAAFYPHPQRVIARTEVALAIAVLLAISAGVVWQARRLPALVWGWSWYAITLAPVSGIVQVGEQAYADRYAYVPLIGLFVAATWTASDEAARRGRTWQHTLGALLAACLAALCLATRAEIEPWRNSESLFRHCIEVAPDSSVAHNNLGMALLQRNQTAQALEQFRKAVELAPHSTDARTNLGNTLIVLGRSQEAVGELENALAMARDDPSIHLNLAKALSDTGRTEAAFRHLEEAMRIDPSYARAPLLLGMLLLRERRLDESIAALRKAVALAPRNPDAHYALGSSLGAKGDLDAALPCFEEVLRLRPGDERARRAVQRIRETPRDR